MSPEEKQKLNELIAAVGHGRVEALDGIYAIAARRMTAVALAVTGERAAAEDVVSDSFVKIVKFAKRYSCDEPMGWLLRIVRNTALDALRKKKRRGEVDYDAYFSIVDESYRDADREAALALEAAIAALGEKERRAIRLRYFLDMTVREIADEMKLPRSTAERLIKKAEDELKSSMEKGTRR